jgi:hypothetical protein
MVRNEKLLTALKVAIVAVAFIALVTYVARGVFPGATVGRLIAIAAGALVGCAVVLVGGMVLSLRFRQWILRQGGIDPQWLWFRADPPGLEEMRGKDKR